MSKDPFKMLGLSPGVHSLATLSKAFRARRNALLSAAARPDGAYAIWGALDELHLAYTSLCDPQYQRRLAARLQRDDASPAALGAAPVGVEPPDRISELRHLIRSSLEDGLIRHSRRERILEHAAQAGLSPFAAQLLIAQEQFGDEPVLRFGGARPQRDADPARLSAQIAAAAVLGLAMFLLMVRWSYLFTAAS